jgi:hypothetical protein
MLVQMQILELFCQQIFFIHLVFFFIIECIRGNGFVLDLQRRDGSFSRDVIVDPIVLGRFEIDALGQTGFIMKLI